MGFKFLLGKRIYKTETTNKIKQYIKVLVLPDRKFIIRLDKINGTVREENTQTVILFQKAWFAAFFLCLALHTQGNAASLKKRCCHEEQLHLYGLQVQGQ